MVRLEDYDRVQSLKAAYEFQFLYGAIGSSFNEYDTAVLNKFQFLYGAIGRDH